MMGRQVAFGEHMYLLELYDRLNLLTQDCDLLAVDLMNDRVVIEEVGLLNGHGHYYVIFGPTLHSLDDVDRTMSNISDLNWLKDALELWNIN